MMSKKLVFTFLTVGLLASTAAMAGSSSDSKEARQCLNQVGSGSSFTYSYKNPGWDGKPCNKPIHVYACKSGSCSSTSKGSDADKVINWNTQWRPGFTPGSSAVTFE